MTDGYRDIMFDADTFGLLCFGDVLAYPPPALRSHLVGGDFEFGDPIAEGAQCFVQNTIEWCRQHIGQLGDNQPLMP